MRPDAGPPIWLEPEPRPFAPHVTDDRYGFTLPTNPSARLEEVLAEKLARLTRSGTARDAFDPVRAATTSPHYGFSIDRVWKLAMLTACVENHGLGPAWPSALSPRPFDPVRWLSPREDWAGVQCASSMSRSSTRATVSGSHPTTEKQAPSREFGAGRVLVP